MRSFLTPICAILLLLVVISPLAAVSIDDDVRAARAAERAEAVRLEQALDSPAQPVDVTVTETPVAAESQSDEKAAEKDAVTTATATEHSSGVTARHTAPSDKPERSDDSETPKVSDEPQTTPSVAATSHDSRPDKVALMLQEEQSGKSGGKRSGSLGTVLLTILKLAVVLVLAYLTILALKWFSTKHDAMPSNNRQFKMVDTLRFNNASSMHLVEIKGTTLLVGCTSGQVSVLKEFDEDETPAVDTEPSGKFAEYLAKYSDMSGKHGASGRIAGLLRDCSGYLRNRYQGARTEARDEK